MRTTRRSWLLLLASAIALTGVVAVLAPADDLQQRAAAPYAPRTAAPGAVPRVAPGTFLENPSAARKDRWPFVEPFWRADPVRMILY